MQHEQEQRATMFSLNIYLFFIDLGNKFISKAIFVYPFRNREKTMTFRAGGRHEGSFKDFFWLKRSGVRREEGRATFNTLRSVCC